MAAWKGHVEAAQQLITGSDGAPMIHPNDPQQREKGSGLQWTPLHAAAREGRIRTVELLIRQGADVNAISTNGWTPLHTASHNDQFEVVELLLENKADPKRKSNFGATALEKACGTKVSQLLHKALGITQPKNQDIPPPLTQPPGTRGQKPSLVVRTGSQGSGHADHYVPSPPDSPASSSSSVTNDTPAHPLSTAASLEVQFAVRKTQSAAAGIRPSIEDLCDSIPSVNLEYTLSHGPQVVMSGKVRKKKARKQEADSLSEWSAEFGQLQLASPGPRREQRK